MERGSTNAKQNLTRRVIKATGVFGSVESLAMLCSLIRTKIVAVCMGTAGIGLLGLYTTAIELLSTLTQLGIRTSAVREIASAPPSVTGKQTAAVLRLGFILAVAGVIITTLAAPLLSDFTFNDSTHTTSFALLSLAVACNTIIATRAAVLQGHHQLKTLAKASAVSSVVSLASAIPIILLWGIDGIVPLLLSYGVVTAATYTAMGRSSSASSHISYSEIYSMTRGILHLGIFLTAANAASWLASYIVMSYINHAGGEHDMGLYQSGYTMTVKYVGIVFTALAVEYFPRLSGYMSRGMSRGQAVLRHETLISVFLVATICSFILAFVPVMVTVLYSKTFGAVTPMVILSVPGLVLRAISWAMAFAIVAHGNGRLYLLTELSSSCVCTVAMITGYVYGGIAGLGFGFTVWYLLYTIIVWTVTRHRLNITLGHKVWLICTAVTASLCVLSIIALHCPGWPVAIAGCMVGSSSAYCLWRMYVRR